MATLWWHLCRECAGKCDCKCSLFTIYYGAQPVEAKVGSLNPSVAAHCLDVSWCWVVPFDWLWLWLHVKLNEWIRGPWGHYNWNALRLYSVNCVLLDTFVSSCDMKNDFSEDKLCFHYNFNVTNININCGEIKPMPSRFCLIWSVRPVFLG